MLFLSGTPIPGPTVRWSHPHRLPIINDRQKVPASHMRGDHCDAPLNKRYAASRTASKILELNRGSGRFRHPNSAPRFEWYRSALPVGVGRADLSFLHRVFRLPFRDIHATRRFSRHPLAGECDHARAARSFPANGRAKEEGARSRSYLGSIVILKRCARSFALCSGR